MRYTSNVGGIRISTHYFNNEDDLDRLFTAISKHLKKRRDTVTTLPGEGGVGTVRQN